MLEISQMYFESATQQNINAQTVRVTPVAARLIINPTARYTIDERGRYTVYVSATNLGDIHIGPGISRDYDVPGAEHIGPRVWAGVEIKLE